ncbi:hypothetical protein KIMH_09880 [Bombiscardovia apis]|uniref:Transposase n=1 Tax=Bombiscardovia apis TaxID=2932182 RepID=A0ABN6SHW4_9BIFI|nr:hypothetical protein [Bombiscardovia apis]BDR54877.1 hypothetical protein KIMH_09880 [Bombiscardovia apis]
MADPADWAEPKPTAPLEAGQLQALADQKHKDSNLDTGWKARRIRAAFAARTPVAGAQ